MNKELLEKEKNLIELIKKYSRAAIAYSGGVDSTYLLYISGKALGDNLLAVTVYTSYMFKNEIEEAEAFAKEQGIKSKILNLPIPEAIMDNPNGRCYLCKKYIFNNLKKLCSDLDTKYVFDGTNFDDTKVYRPGLKALEELHIISPLKEIGFTKEEIRQLSFYHKLKTYDKPSNPCILTRLAEGERIEEVKLRRIEEGENFIKSLGYNDVRIRSIGNTARIEFPKNRIKDVFLSENYTLINTKLKELGFTFVSIDLEGYKMGNMSREKDA
ncbi:MAG: ATP-dependent sacrificial sulfur transferase LarE [Bacillota bacterium]|nr:ATP-dependent sacrificial sulfur transferase LarE [Bacillota bacterium]